LCSFFSDFYFCNWPITSTAQFGPGPLLVEPDMADLRLLQNGKVVSTSANMFTMTSANVTLTARFK
jgi:hypothetical protein